MNTSRENYQAEADRLTSKRQEQHDKASQLWNLIQGNSPVIEPTTEGEQK